MNESATNRPGVLREFLARFRGEKLLFACFIVAGALLRLYGLKAYPPGLDNDEALEAMVGLDVLDHHPYHLFSSRGYALETLHGYILAPILSWFGPSILPLRLYSTVLGLATLLLLFWLVRRLFGTATGMCAAALLALSTWHVVYSRIAFRMTFAPVYALAAAILLFSITQKPHILKTLALGLVNLLGVLTYTAYRPYALALFLVLCLWPLPRKQKALLVSLGFLLPAGIYSGLAWHLEGSLLAVIQRGTYVLSVPQLSFIKNVFYSVLFFFGMPPAYMRSPDHVWGDGVHRLLSDSLFAPVSPLFSLFLCVGVWVSATRVFKTGLAPHKMLLSLFVVPLLVLGVAGPTFTRLLITLPFACGLAALGFSASVEGLSAWFPRWRRTGIAMILLLGLGGWLVADLWTLSRRVNYDVIFCKNEIRFANAVAQEPFPRGAAVLYVFMCVDTVRFLIPEDRDAQVIVSDFESMVSDRMSQPNQLWVYIHGAALDSEQKVTWLKETYPHSEIQRFVASGGSWFVRAMVRS